MGVILLLISMLVGITGFLFLSEATMGVGIIGVAALLGVYARIAQADAHHKKVKRLLEELVDSKLIS